MFRWVHPGAAVWIFHFAIVISAVIVLGYIFLGGLTSAIYNEVLQFFLIVAGFLPLVWIGLRNVGGWDGLKAALPAAYDARLARDDACEYELRWGWRWVRAGDGAGVCAEFRVLVHGLPGDPDGDGGGLGRKRAAGAADCGDSEDVLSVPGDLPGLLAIATPMTASSAKPIVNGVAVGQRRMGRWPGPQGLIDSGEGGSGERQGALRPEGAAAAGLRPGDSEYAAALTSRPEFWGLG
jgi:hypothetical protein